MQINSPATAPDYTAGNLREGTLDSKVLLHGKEGSLSNYRFSWETAADSWSTPRHRHNFDQIRFPISGVVEYGADLPTLPAGVVAYFPESVRYGPQVRHDKSVTVTLQFGGASCNGFLSPEERGRGQEELRQKGKFEKGVYTWQDENGKTHNQDAYEAVWEHMRQRELQYAAPRYKHHIVMDPQASVYLDDAAQPGVARKLLGCFTERQMTIWCLRVAPGASLRLDAHPSPQVLLVLSGTVAHEGREHAVHTAFGLEAGESVSLRGVSECEIALVQLPVFTQAEQDAFAAVSRREAGVAA